MEVDGNIVFFNEAEAVASLNEYVDEDETRSRDRKTKGKREKDIQGLPVIQWNTRCPKKNSLPSLVKMAGMNLKTKSTDVTVSHL